MNIYVIYISYIDIVNGFIMNYYFLLIYYKQYICEYRIQILIINIFISNI